LTWQDELRQLDEELAAGRITADEYRMRRDRVTAAAANPAAGSPQPDASAQAATSQPDQPIAGESTQLMTPLSGGQPGPPQATPPQAGDAERTQAVNPAWTVGGQGADAERTQAVPRSALPQMPGYSPPSPAGGFPQQQPPYQQQGWQDEQLPPSWTGPELPSAAPWNPSGFESTHADPWSAKQGPEVFEEGGGSKTGKIVAGVVAVVVLAGLVVGAFLLWGQDSGDDGTQAQTSAAAPPPAPPTKVANPMGIADLPGQQQDTKVRDLAGVQSLNYLTPEEIDAYEKASPGQAALVFSQLAGGGRVVVLVIQAESATAAGTAVEKLVQLQIGFKATKVTNAPKNVSITQSSANTRAHYASGDTIVRIDVTGGDQASRRDALNSVLTPQLSSLSADG